jgi:hypothetical protein
MQPLGKSGSHPIVFDPSMWATLAQSQQPQSAPVRQKAQPKKGGRGGILTSLISELGGAGGAAGGAAAGAAAGSVVPGVGTAIGGLAGAILGGFAGGTSGRLVENKVRDNKYNLGSALKEGGIDAAFSGLPGAVAAGKGVKGAIVGKNAYEQLAKDTGTALKAPPKAGMLETTGRQLKAGAGGYGIGARLGSNRLNATESANVEKALSNLGVGASSPEKMASALRNRITNLEGQLGGQYASADARLSNSELSALKKRITERVSKEVGEPDSKFVANRLSELGKAKSTTGVWGFNKNLSNFTNYGSNTEGKLVDREAAARIMKDESRKFLNAKVPGVKATNDLYHGARTAEQLALNNAADLKSGGITGKLLNLSPVRATEAKVGSTLEKIGKASAGTGGNLSKVTNQAKLQAPASLTRALSGLGQPPAGDVSAPAPQSAFQPPDSPSLYNPNDPFGAGSQLVNAYSAQGQSAQPQESAYGEQNLMADIQRDPKHTADYLNLYKTLSSLSAQQSKANGNNIGKVSSQNFTNAQSGYSALQALGQLYQTDPGVIQRSGTPGRGLPIIGGLVANKAGTTQMDALAANVADKYIRLTTGATANADEIKTLKTQMLPRPGDSPAQAQYKLQQFASLFQSILQQAQQPSSSSGLGDALSQLQGAY